MSNFEEIFKAIDSDGSGKVDKKELRAMIVACNDGGLLEPKIGDEQIEQAVNEIISLCDDGEADGKLTLAEFEAGMKKLTGQ